VGSEPKDKGKTMEFLQQAGTTIGYLIAGIFVIILAFAWIFFPLVLINAVRDVQSEMRKTREGVERLQSELIKTRTAMESEGQMARRTLDLINEQLKSTAYRR